MSESRKLKLASRAHTSAFHSCVEITTRNECHDSAATMVTSSPAASLKTLFATKSDGVLPREMLPFVCRMKAQHCCIDAVAHSSRHPGYELMSLNQSETLSPFAPLYQWRAWVLRLSVTTENSGETTLARFSLPSSMGFLEYCCELRAAPLLRARHEGHVKGLEPGVGSRSNQLHALPTLRSRSPCASWAPPHSGVCAGSAIGFPRTAPVCP